MTEIDSSATEIDWSVVEDGRGAAISAEERCRLEVDVLRSTTDGYVRQADEVVSCHQSKVAEVDEATARGMTHDQYRYASTDECDGM
jgi:hypothetical protein